MSKYEADREDILREATALVPRAEIGLPGQTENVVLGFRQSGAVSLYFGAEPVYQFNSAGELRRAFVAGKLLKAEGGKLAALDRRRTAGEVQLVRHDLVARETEQILADLHARLEQLQNALSSGRFVLQGEVPEQSGALERFARFLGTLQTPVAIARSPHAR